MTDNDRRNDRRTRRRKPKRAGKLRAQKPQPEPPKTLAIDAIGLAMLERDDKGAISMAQSAAFSFELKGDLLILRAVGGGDPIVIGIGFVDTLCDAIEARRRARKPSRWAWFWRWVRRK